MFSMDRLRCRPGTSTRRDYAEEEELELEVSMISGQFLAKVRCRRSEGLGCLRKRVQEACAMTGPCFSLVHGTTVLRRKAGEPDPLESLPAGASLVLLKQSVSCLSTELVGTHGAAFRGSQPEVCQLLEEGAEIDHRDGSRLRTPLMWAASAGNVAICNQLLRHGANPCLRASGTKAAQLAEANGYNELAEMLASAEKEWMEHGTVQGALAPAPKPRFRRPLVAVDCGQALALSVLLLSWVIGRSSHSWCASAGLVGLALAAFLVTPVRKLVTTNLPSFVDVRCRRRSKSVVAPMPFKPHAAADVVEGPLQCNSGCRQYLKSAIWEM